MGDIKPGFYFANTEYGSKMLVLADYDKDEALRIQDHFGGLYGEDNLKKKEPLTPEEVKSIIKFDEMKVDFVHKGLEQLAKPEKPLIPSNMPITSSRPVSPFTDPHFYDDYEPGNR